MKRPRLLALVLAAAVGVVLSIAASSFGGTPRDIATGNSGIQQTGTVPRSADPGAPCQLHGEGPVVGGAPSSLQAGTSFTAASCNWFPRTTCTNRVTYALKTAAGQNFVLGALPPQLYAVQAAFPIPFVTSSPIDGSLTIPEAVNLNPGSQTVAATLSAKQTLSIGLFSLGCVPLLSKKAKPVTLTILPAATDDSVITAVQASRGAAVPQGGSQTLSWQLSRTGNCRVSLVYMLTPSDPISVIPGAYPQNTVFSDQCPAGSNSLPLPLADGSGHSFPAGTYEYKIELIDPPGSQLVPAAPKSGSFTLEYA